MKGFFVRGGIAFGKHYMDDHIVFGDALIELHDMENKIKGGPPRIILTQGVKDIVSKQINFYSNINHSPQYQDLLQDADGSYFLNYLQEAFSIFPEGDIFFEILAAHKTKIVENLNRFSADPYIRNKYEWLARYQNFICTEVANNYPPSSDPDQDYTYATASQSAQKALDYLISNEDKEVIYPKRIT